jgi:hypothetical protein
VFDLPDRVSVTLHRKLVATVNRFDVTTVEVLDMIIMGKGPEEVTPKDLAKRLAGASLSGQRKVTAT